MTLRCPSCRLPRLSIESASVICGNCQNTYPASDGIPILVRDYGAHTADIERAKEINPGWYVDQQWPEETSPWRHHIKKRRLYVEDTIARELKRRGLEKARILLDLGCGDGLNLRWLSRFGDSVYGSDYNMLRLTRAKHMLPEATIFLADNMDFPADDGSFDLIFYNHVIEHIPDDRRALSEVRRILAPGGMLILGTPNEGSWWWQHAYKRAPDFLETTDHVHFYTEQIITARMRAAGLTVTEVHHMGWGPPDFRLDGRWRQHKIVDDAFEWVGKIFLRRQASSLYIIATA